MTNVILNEHFPYLGEKNRDELSANNGQLSLLTNEFGTLLDTEIFPECNSFTI